MKVDTRTTDQFDVGLQYISGLKNRVELSAEDLPQGLKIEFNPSGGIPDFTSVASLDIENVFDSGTYATKIVARSTDLTINGTVDITIPLTGYMTVDGRKFKVFSTFNTFSNAISFDIKAKKTDEEFAGIIKLNLPDGVSQCPIDNAPSAAPNALGIEYYPSTNGFKAYHLMGSSGKFARVVRDGDKFIVDIPDITLYNSPTDMVVISGKFYKQ